MEGAADDGIGEYVTLNFDGFYKVSGLKIYNGYQKSTDLFNKNGRVKSLKVEFSDGTEELHDLIDQEGEQDISFNSDKICEWIKIYINDVFSGTKYQDTVISEIELY